MIDRVVRAAILFAVAHSCSAAPVLAQSSNPPVSQGNQLPPVEVVTTPQKKKASPKPVAKASKTAGQPVAASSSPAPEGPPSNGQTATGPVHGFVATRTATGTKTDAALVEVPQSISVVTRDQVEVQGAESLEQALTYTPGVIVDSYGSNPEQDYISLRGFQAPIFVDGLKQFRDYVVGAQMGFEPYGYERIEVLRGPASVLYGQSEVGGIVNMITKRPTEKPQNEIAFQFGSFERAQAAFDFSGPVDRGGKVSYRLTGLGRTADGQMDFQGDDRIFIAPVLQFRPDADTKFTIISQYQRDRDQLRPVPLPPQGTIFSNPNGKIPSDRFLGDPSFDAFRRDQYAVGYELEHKLDSTWTLRQNLRYTYVDQLENTSLPLYDDISLFHGDLRTVERIPWNDRNRIGVFSVDNQAQAKFATGDVLHKALFGVDYSYVKSHWNFAGNYDYPTIDAFDPVYLGYGTLAPGIDDVRRQTQTGVYVQDMLSIDRWRFTVGGRYDWAEGSTDSRLDPQYGGPDQNDEKFTWRAGAVYLFDNGLAPYFSYATSFDPPIGADAYGNPLVPTTGEQYEVGIKYQPRGSNSFVAFSAFDITKQNVLTSVNDSHAPNPFGQVQLGEVRVRGFEAEAKIEVARGFNVIGAYTYLDSEITKDTDTTNLGHPLALTPENQFSLWADYVFQDGPFAGIGLGAGVRYRGDAWGSKYEILTPSYTLADASVRYDLGKLDKAFDGYSVAVTARNLFDKEYFPSCSYWEGCFYGDRRNVMATIKYQW